MSKQYAERSGVEVCDMLTYNQKTRYASHRKSELYPQQKHSTRERCTDDECILEQVHIQLFILFALRTTPLNGLIRTLLFTLVFAYIFCLHKSREERLFS